MSTGTGYLPLLSSRESYVDYLEGFEAPGVEESNGGRPQRRRIKTYMLETARDDQAVPDLGNLFPDPVRLHRIDDTLYRVEDADHGDGVIGLIEALDERHPVLYTTLLASESNKWVNRAVDRNPWLDRLWLSSPILFELWKYVQRHTPDHRYVRLGFEHEAWYESTPDLDTSHENTAEEENASAEADGARSEWMERRRSTVMLTERLELLNTKLRPLMELYDPLHSLVQLQIPGGGRGGHRLFHDGHATNWTDSFLEHRATIGLVVELYRRVTARAEDRLWVDSRPVGEDGFLLTGAPVTIRFHQPLSQATFNRFVDLALRRRTSKFRIGGYVTRRSPTKVQMAAIDRHLWQPFLLEATSEYLLVILPRGTCGNTIHRLVTNVQRFVDPKVDVWLGSEPYATAVSNSMKFT